MSEKRSPQPGGNVNEQMLALSDKQRLAAAIRATLLWHSSDWNPEVQAEWHRLTKGSDATNKSLCDFLRKTLTEGGWPHWGEPL